MTKLRDELDQSPDAVYARWRQIGSVSDADLDILLNDPRYLADMYPKYFSVMNSGYGILEAETIGDE